MAEPDFVKQTSGSKLVFQLGNGANPEVFSTICTINADRGITFNKGMSDEETIDCANPTAIAWRVSEAQTLSIDVAGGGKVHKPDIGRMEQWWRDTKARNGRMILDDALPANVITWAGQWDLRTFDITGPRTEKLNSTLAITSNGPITSTYGANVAYTPPA